MYFSQLAVYFKKLEETSSRLDMTRILADLFTHTSADEIDKVCYLLQGRVTPPYERNEFGLADRLVLKSFVSAFAIEEATVRKKFKELGDLGKTVEYYRSHAHSQKLFHKNIQLTVKDIFEQIYKLSQQQGGGSQEVKLSIVADMLENLDALSCRYLVRMLVGNMRLGFSDMTVLDALSWVLKGDKSLRKDIERAYNVIPDMGALAAVIKSKGIAGLKNIQPKVGTPILMARAERVGSPAEILEKMDKCAIEPKYDGFRLQVHLDKHKNVRIFSRNLEDVAYMYPDIAEAVKKELKAEQFIVEGEAIGYNFEKGTYLPFQETVQRKRKYNIAQKSKEVPLRLFLFDLLYLNGHSYLEKPYSQRRSTLSSLIHKHERATLEVATEEVVSTAEKIEALFTEAVSRGLEGIMAKKLDGKYEAGARGFNWIKFKRSYASSLKDTVDVVIMGYDCGKGKRTSFGIGAFLVGVYDPKHEKYLTVSKIGTGLTDEEWRDIRRKADLYKVKEIPREYRVEKLMEVDTWIRPHLVVEIRADEISRSPMHSAKLALRFPRLERFRPDKKPTDSTTLAELEKLFKSQKHVSI